MSTSNMSGTSWSFGYRSEDILWLVEHGLLTLGYQSSSYLTDRVPELGAVDLPFLFANKTEARNAIDGELGEFLARKIEERVNYRVLGYFENGFRHISQYTVKNMVTGSVAFAAYAAEVAKNYPVNIALHTDHCPQDKLDGFVRPLIDISAERVARGEAPLFQSHMWDGSAVPLDENLQIAEELLARCAAAHIILEIEVGVVGGEEDGVANEINDQLYTTPEDAIATVKALGAGEKGRYLTALTFGNVHGVYKPGNVKLRPEILKSAQEAAAPGARARRVTAARSTWSSTAGPARRPTRSARPSTSAS